MRAFLGDHFLHDGGRVDQVEPFAFDHLQGHCVLAVETGSAFAVFKRQVDLGQIAQGDHTVAVRLDWQVVDIARFVE